MSHDITHCTTTTCPKRDTCRRAVAWQAIVGTDFGLVSAIDGEQCQQQNHDMYWHYQPQNNEA